MLAQLLKTTRSRRFQAVGTIRLREVAWDHTNARLDILVGATDDNVTEGWTITAIDVCAMSLNEPNQGKRLSLVRRHPLIDSEIGPFAEMRFGGTPEECDSLLTDLWTCHESVAGSSIPLDHFFGATAPLPDLLRSGQGEATGPAGLLRAYAKVFRKHGFKVSVTNGAHTKTYYWRGSWRRKKPSVRLCFINASYVIASRFTAERW